MCRPAMSQRRAPTSFACLSWGMCREKSIFPVNHRSSVPASALVMSNASSRVTVMPT
jgi:hypothetical protein